jgi:DNA mismatch endonuclease, patch repair protein
MGAKYKILNDNKVKVPRFNEEAGFYTTSKSSKVMRKIKSQNSQAEILIRRNLWKLGFRYKINNKKINGKPDIVFAKKRIAIFIDGDFWHGYNWAIKKKGLKSNRKYWIPKIERNIQRDKEVNTLLESEGWKVLRFWEHDIHLDPIFCVEIITKHITEVTG